MSLKLESKSLYNMRTMVSSFKSISMTHKANKSSKGLDCSKTRDVYYLWTAELIVQITRPGAILGSIHMMMSLLVKNTGRCLNDLQYWRWNWKVSLSSPSPKFSTIPASSEGSPETRKPPLPLRFRKPLLDSQNRRRSWYIGTERRYRKRNRDNIEDRFIMME